MPPSSDQDNNIQTTSSDSKPSKVTQKTAAAQTSSKNGKKNGTAKDSGAGSVMAAVKKEGKMNTKQAAQPAPNKSPEIKPTNSSPPAGGNPVTSPLLDALSSASFARSTSQNTTEWTKNLPGFSTSPNNLINLGESPPTQPSSYEDRLSNFGWTTREQRGISNGHYHSTSPPAPNRRRPLSYNQLDGHIFPTFDDQRSQVSSFANRRSSMYSPPSRYSPQPPLPHQPQAHFYGAPDANLLLSPPGTGLVAGDRGYYCGFDRLPLIATHSTSKQTENVILTGYEGGMKVQAITKRGTNQLWSLEGLRGGVFNAKILPWTVGNSEKDQFPLVAAVVHGPVWESNDSHNGDDIPSEKRSLTPTESLQGSPRVPETALPQDTDVGEYYQTTVEVYSIPRNSHVATLLMLPKKALAIPINSPLFEPPSPDGSLTIRADNGIIVVASGISGETWIFRQGDLGSPEKFPCIGKVWTTVQHGVTVEPAQGSLHHGDWNMLDPSTGRKQYKASILSLNGRWLAYCPPSPSTQVTLGATLPTQARSRIPGFNARAPPQLPPVNCLVETPGSESMVKQILQVGTQKFIEGATYLGGQGVQAWNNYWNKSGQNQASPPSFPYQPQNAAPHFPPTHAGGAPAPVITKEPGLISILDLGALASRVAHGGMSIHPLSTFRVPHGCSFLSFAPSGLALFTASSKGDVQFVWDLMRIQYAKSSFLKGSVPGIGTQSPHVRQIAHFSRMTIARIVDVVWTSPHGERAAMVTEPGTVHVLDLPASAFTWPPPRRKAAVSKPEEEATPSTLTATGMATSAVTSLWNSARPLVSRRRRSTAGMSAMNVTAQAGHGTQALAAGISRSVGAATGRMNELRKSGTTKLHLPPSSTIPARGCVLLLNGKKNDSVILVGGGIVRIFTIKNRRADRPADKQKASRGAKFVEFRLPPLPNVQLAPREMHPADDLDLTEGDFEPRFKGLSLSTAPASATSGIESSIPQAEIESNAPYQPFHTDRRVALHIYSNEEVAPPSPSVSALLAPPVNTRTPVVQASNNTKLLAFGLPIKTTRLDVGPSQLVDDDLTASLEQGRALPASSMERVLRVTDSNEDMEQIVVTTRRRKGASRAEGAVEGDEEGFFEDDCEVLDFASQRV